MDASRSQSQISNERHTDGNSLQSGAGVERHTDNSRYPFDNEGDNDTGLKYLPLYQAVLKGNWESASTFFRDHPEALTARFGIWQETALHIAVGTGREIQFVEKLVDIMEISDLETPDSFGITPLAKAVAADNIDAIQLLVKKNPELPNVRHRDFQGLPLHLAPIYAKRETILYLLEVTRDVEPSPYTGTYGSSLVTDLLIYGHYDIALELMYRYPKISTFPGRTGDYTIALLDTLSSSLPSGNRFNLCQRFIYHYIPTTLMNFSNQAHKADVENPPDAFHLCKPKYWWVLLSRVPYVKHIHEMKMKHHQLRQVVKCLCEQVMKLGFLEIKGIFETAVYRAAITGTPEIIEEILELFPFALWFRDENYRGMFELAVLHRREKVFNLLYQMGGHRKILTQLIHPVDNDNILHLAGGLAPPNRLSLVTGAVLQMQRELQWFKEVENSVPPIFKELVNKNHKTPYMVFCEQHKKLAQEGERWMKHAASSYTIVASLIATVVFAAAITVPGGNHGDTGVPNFAKERAFKIFTISDALSLFSSIASILMFLSILTARYAEIDFLHTLPKRMIFGLLTLFLSITSMMIAFSAALYLLFGEKASVLVVVAAFTCLPVTLYEGFRFPALLELISSTYGPGIFGKQSDRILY